MNYLEVTSEHNAAVFEAWVAGHPWAILPEFVSLFAQTSRATVTVSEAAFEAARDRSRRTTAGAVSVVPLRGVITPKGSLLSLLFGGGPGGLEAFRSELAQAVGDPDVSSIVLDIDSPGGLVDGVPEAAAAIRQARKTKPVVAVANPLAASAAYWLGSQATQMVASTSGETGSIGVYQLHREISGALDQAGIKATLVKAGKYKVERNPFEPLTGSAEHAMQEAVNDYYDMFVKDVALGRGAPQRDVRNGYGEGRVLTAARSLKAGLVDAVKTLDEVVGGLADGHLPAGRALAPAAVVGFDFAGEPIEVLDLRGAEFVDTSADDENNEMGYTADDKMRILAVLAD